MANLDATSFTITLAATGENGFVGHSVSIKGRRRTADLKITFGNGVLLYPTGGIPLPSFAAFFMLRNLDSLVVYVEDMVNFVHWKHDRVNNVLRGYLGPGGGAAASLGPSFAVPNVGAVGVASTGAQPAIPINPGPFTEIINSLAPLATTIYVRAEGW